MKLLEKILGITLCNKLKMLYNHNHFIIGVRYMITNKDPADKFFIFLIIIINLFWFTTLFGTLFIMLMDFAFYTYATKIGKLKKD